MFSPRVRRQLGWVLAALLVVIGFAAPAHAATNLIQNPGMEALDANGFPVCWEQSGAGDNTFAFDQATDTHSGRVAMRISITRLASGDRKAMMLENAQCAPRVIMGRQYELSVWYKSTTAANAVTLFRHDTKLGWQYWLDPATLPATGTWQNKVVNTPTIPANTDQITWGVSVYGTGTLITDDYSMVDKSVPTVVPRCADPTGCATGKWQVMPFQSTVRAVHAVVMYNGKVLLVAGSGNDPKAFASGTFKTAVYDPANGSFTSVPTPVDLFCSGHVQLPDGRVLVVGGNKNYPTADGTVGYQGLKNSYIFDPATNQYTRVNDMLAGHWYPSATMLGNGDVISLGGLGEDSRGTTTTDYFSTGQQRWLPMDQVQQTWSWWGLYPAMVLMQDGRLFYTGSHTFGVGLPGAGASIYNYASGAITDVPGLQNKDERDQSMSVLLPPAQSQRVLTVGGGNGDTGATANRLTDLIDLKAASPVYQPGPPLPQGTLTGGTPETGDQGKMYVSLVLLPDGTVFENGGALHNRADPVFEASIFDPNTNTFRAGMATDPVPRTYHSSAFLLPDGRVMAVGDNPANGSFDTRISVYSPPYLFKGVRPLAQVASTKWAYGSTQRVVVSSAVTRASLIRPAAVTHSSDPNQRFVELPITVTGTNTIDVNVTSNPNLAPPGWYMLFVHNANGVPSVATWVKLG